MTRAYGAGQTLVVDRIDLLALQASEAWAGGVQTGLLAATGITIAAFGWVSLVGAALAWLGPRWSWPSALALVGTVQLAGGLVLIAAARTRRSGTQP